MQEAKIERVRKARKPTRGRPKDPNLESKVYDAAIKLYSEVGWAGFNFDQIAKMSGVGKAALYNRWPNKGALLRATFDLRWDPLAEIDKGSLRADLLELTNLILTRYMSSNRGGIVLNMQVDGRRFEDFRELAKPFSAIATDRIHAIFERAKSRGEIRDDVDLEVAGLLLAGPITSRFGRIENADNPLTEETARKFATKLVDLVMVAIAA